MTFKTFEASFSLIFGLPVYLQNQIEKFKLEEAKDNNEIIKVCFMKNILVIVSLLLCTFLSAQSQKPTEWTFIGYRVAENVPGCNSRMAYYGYAWSCNKETTNEFFKSVKEKFPGQRMVQFYHFKWNGDIIALVEKKLTCSSKKTTHISYSFHSAKNIDSLKVSLEKDKSSTPDIQSYRIVKILNYHEETKDFQLTGQCFVKGETN